MTAKPRKLKVLIIDDELPMSGKGFSVPETLEIMRPGGSLPGINSWKTAMQFWRSFRNNEIPDLIVADVRFVEDQTSPLSLLFQGIPNEIPTGLSHLKDFAALSRISGVPVGVGLRTWNPGMWTVKTTASDREQAMGLLAAHLVGEIAAILGEDLGLDHLDRRDSLRVCLEWLIDKTGKGFLDGLHVAIKDYRKRLFDMLTSPKLSGVNVMLGDYMVLRSWCRRMEQSPHPLDAENDIGLTLTYDSGRRDIVSLASIFADYDHITTKSLEASAFILNSDVEEPWKNDDDHIPRIGAFLCRLGKLNIACDVAADAVKVYQVDRPLPDDYKPSTLATLKSRGGLDDLTVGLIVLFQLIRIEQRKSQRWEEAFENYSYDPIKHKFKPGIQEKNSLRKVLQSLATYIKQADPTGEGISINDLVEEFPDSWIKRICAKDKDCYRLKWHFDRLVDADVLDHRIENVEGDLYTLKPAWLRSNKPLPIPPMPILTPKIADEQEPDRIKWLRESLGYQADFNSMARVLADAFELVKPDQAATAKDSERANIRGKIGRAFLNRLGAGELPPFLADLCREYATNYLNWPEDKWPTWLRRA